MAKIIKSQDGEAVEFPTGVDLGPNKIKFQRKFLNSDVNSAILDITDLRLNGLTIGNIYRVSYNALIQNLAGGTQSANTSVNHGGVELMRMRLRQDSSPGTTDIVDKGTVVFTATATTVTVSFSEANNSVLYGNGGFEETWISIEELPNHTETTDFT